MANRDYEADERQAEVPELERVAREWQAAVFHVQKMRSDVENTEQNLKMLREGFQKSVANERALFDRLEELRPFENQSPKVNSITGASSGRWEVNS